MGTYHKFIFRDALGPEVPIKQYMDYYEEACKERERQHVPSVGLSVDRRTLRHLQEVLQPKSVQCLMCFVCSEKHLCIRDMDRDGRIVNKGDIAYHTIGAFNQHACQDTADRKFTENLDFKTYCDRYACKSKVESLQQLLVIQILLRIAGNGAVKFSDHTIKKQLPCVAQKMLNFVASMTNTHYATSAEHLSAKTAGP